MAEGAAEGQPRTEGPRVFLDTCVLFPPILRDFLLGLADAGLFTPLWSQSVLAEWLHVTARKGEAGAPEAIERMTARWPEAMTPDGAPDLLDLPDAGDTHVLAAAIAGQADILLTLNLRDFPNWATAPHGIHVQAPDPFVMDLWLQDAMRVEGQVARVWPTLEGRPLRNALKRARLPRLGKALEQGG
ncbi:RSP_2648 family PIN domain-containing protein [Pararhodobacter oceanensis]|uniref:RSP_2648 family PIN domain-containing protein n=1 Tax=Pararhodobacter oceanensis TaxID=2172121 RepID=UPI003A9066D6